MSVKGQTSRPAHLSCQVPQGSVFGSVLFILYTAPLLSCIQSHYVYHQSYVDDMQLYYSNSPAESHSAVNIIETCISNVKDWIAQNTNLMIKMARTLSSA